MGRHWGAGRRWLAAAAAALAGSTLIFGGAAFGRSDGFRTLDGLAISGLSALHPIGGPSRNDLMRVGISVSHPDPAGEDAALAAMYEPTSPSYHQFLTPAEFQARFGVPASTADAVRSWLARGRLDIVFSSSARDYFVASGHVGDVQKLFGVRLLRYRYGATTFVANDRAPRVPASLPISGIVGLDSRAQHKPLAAPAAPHAVNTGSLTPADLWSVYEMPGGAIGGGIDVGIIGVGDTGGPITSLNSFENTYHLRHVPVRVVRTPSNGDYSDTSVAGEFDLDVAAVAGMAPGIGHEVLYASPTYADTDLMGSLSHWVSDASAPPIMNMSFGECERGPANPVLTNPALAPIDGNEHPSATLPQLGLANSSHPAEDQILKQAVMEGRTLFASAGDAGAGCSAVYGGAINTNGVLPQLDGLTEDPASSPYAVGVGGTVLYTDGNTPAHRVLEYAWTHSGGNASPFITAPDYQQNVPNITRPCLMDASGSPSNTGQLCRGVPDVAALSGDITGNGYVAGGGTSLSAPIWAGVWARIIGAAPAGRHLGFANEALYRLAKDPAKYANAFYDITQGSNGNPAMTGWDYVTGWGVPRVGGLIKELLGVTPPPGNQGVVEPQSATSGSASSACGLAFTDAKGDNSNTEVPSGFVTPSTDIIDGSMRYSALTNTLTYTISLASLAAQVPTGYTTMQWVGYFNTPDGTQHFVRAVLDLTGATAFEYGTFVPNPTGVGLSGVSEFDGTTTGKLVEGTPGKVELVVPAALAPVGTHLTGLYAVALQGDTLPASAPGYFRGVSPVMDTAPDTGTGTFIVEPCVTNVPRPSVVTLPPIPIPTTSTFALPVKLSGSGEGTEPRIVFDHNDHGWAITNLPGSSVAVVYETTDHGRTWVRTSGDPAGQTLPTIDVDVVATRTGRIIGAELDTAGLNFVTSYSDDGGKTWTQSSGTQLVDMDRQWLAVGPDDASTHLPTVYLLYHNLVSGSVSHNMWVMKSTDNGATFGPPVPITLPGEPAWLDLQCADSGGPSSLAVDQKTGRIYAFWGTRSSAAGGCAAQPFEVNVVAATKVWAASSPDDSPGSWTQTPVVDDSVAGNIVGMQLSPGTLDRAGNVWVTYPESPNAYPDYDGAAIKVRWAGSNMASWSKPITVAPGGGPGNVLAHIVAGEPGRIAVAYFHGVQIAGGTIAWYLHVARSYDAMSATPHFVDEQISNIPTYTGTASELMGACGSGPAAGVENGFACSRSTDVWGITLDAHCRVYVAWPTVSNSAPKSSGGTYVSSQINGRPLCGNATAVAQRPAPKPPSVLGKKVTGTLPATGVDDTGDMTLGVMLVAFAAAVIARRRIRA